MPAAVPIQRQSALFIVASGIAIALVVTLSAPVRAATFTVNSTVDASDANTSDGVCEATAGVGDCTLRAAIEQANALAGTDTITVAAGTYLLSLGQLTITQSVAINGDVTAPISDRPIIDADDNSRVFELTSADVSMSGVSIQNGATGDEDNIGAGILVRAGATLNLVNSEVIGNDTPSGGGGIAVSGGGGAVLSRTNVGGNTAGVEGGGILVDDGATVALTNGTQVFQNSASYGGGINNDNGTLTLTSSSVRLNDALFSELVGGGFGGGIWTDGSLTATDSFIGLNTADTSGGGIFHLASDAEDGAVSLTKTTVSGNTAAEGGGIFSLQQFSNADQMLTLVNSTVSGNTAVNGGGIYVEGILDTDFVTIASNQAGVQGNGGGIWTQDFATFRATIVANNSPGGDCFHNDTGVTSEGNNLDSDDTCQFDDPLTDHPDTDPDLGPLASNGGPTQTHALLPGSPAIDAVVLAPGVGCVPTDQRGVGRPQDGDSNGVLLCDIGAYELALPAASINDVSVIEGNSGEVDAVFTVTLSAASSGTVTMGYLTANGSATQPADYRATGGLVTFTPGDTSETITVKVVGDTLDEPNETFFVNLSSPVGATIADAQGTGNILDDEGPIVTLAPTPAPASGTLGSTSLPDTGVGGSGLGIWAGVGGAIGLVVLSAAVLIGNRRRHVRAR